LIRSVEIQKEMLLNVAMNCPHLQPVSLGRRELRVLFPLPKERARVRAAKDSNPKIIRLFSNAQQERYKLSLPEPLISYVFGNKK
jgi:hypothetical protein